MLVCVCNGISDKDIDLALQEGSVSYKTLQQRLGLGGNCGQCASFAKQMISDKISTIQAANSYHLATEIRV